MKLMVKYSIIVPIYKIEKYIEECILSVVNQSYNNYELILVDDGSPDNSGAICDRYSKEYDNIKVIHKKNGGLSDARNYGINAATGEYILFLDGDDTLHNECLKKIDKQLDNEIDLLSCDFCIYGENKDLGKPKTVNINSMANYIDIVGDIPWSAWCNIYKSKIVKDNNIYFEKGLIGAEDCDFFVRYFEKAAKKKYCNIIIVNYRVNRDGSITNTMSFKAIMGELNIFSKYFYKYYTSDNKEIYCIFANKYINTITTIDSIQDKEEIRQIVENIKSNKIILKKSKGIKYVLAKVIWKIFGFEKGTKLIRKII